MKHGERSLGTAVSFVEVKGSFELFAHDETLLIMCNIYMYISQKNYKLCT